MEYARLTAVFFFLSFPVAAEAQKPKTWQLDCKAEKEITCEGEKCALEKTLSMEFQLSPRKASVGLYSIHFTGLPLVKIGNGELDAGDISFLISGTPKGQPSRYTLVGQVTRKTNKFKAMVGETIYSGLCKRK